QEIQANPNVSGDVPTKTVTNADGLGNPGPLVQNATVGNNVEQSTVEVQVVGFDQNAVDPITGPIGGPGLYVQVTAYSTDPSFGAGASSTSITAVPENAGPQFAQFTTPASAGASVFFQFTLANLTRNDVGTGQAFTTYKNTPAGSGQPLSVNVRGDEGTDAQVGIPAVTSQSLGIADITVAQPVNVDPFNTPQYTDSNTIGAKDAEVRVSNAIDQVGAARAQVGAQTVAIENSANDTAIQAVAEQAGRSAIRDADIGQETTALAKDQILEKIATSTIVSVQDSEKSMAGTLSDIISSGPKAK
ncbi:MAG TPA: flagellin, partial [Candidatus Baltobacteraceae bacterium]|nr:flagellin [Candidatus Baltobacteraceae bacterium]